MADQQINSHDNSLLRRLRLVRDGKASDSIYVEGLRLCEEALRSSLEIEAVVYSEEIARKPRAAELIDELRAVCPRLAAVSEKLLASVSYAKTPQGIVLLGAKPNLNGEGFKRQQPESPLVVVMHGINNPVNVGAIIRTAEAAGVSGVITTPRTSDPFSPKSLRGAMGSAFRLPIWSGIAFPGVIDWCRSRSIRTIAADVEGSITYTDLDWSKPSALVVGPESSGFTEEELKTADTIVKIPMEGEVESLNVGVATAVLLYEALRQRRQ